MNSEAALPFLLPTALKHESERQRGRVVTKCPLKYHTMCTSMTAITTIVCKSHTNICMYSRQYCHCVCVGYMRNVVEAFQKVQI